MAFWLVIGPLACLILGIALDGEVILLRLRLRIKVPLERVFDTARKDARAVSKPPLFLPEWMSRLRGKRLPLRVH